MYNLSSKLGGLKVKGIAINNYTGQAKIGAYDHPCHYIYVQIFLKAMRNQKNFK